MQDKFYEILKKYMTSVDSVCNILIKNISVSENQKIRNKYEFFEYRAKCRKMKFEAEGITYNFNGNGCIAHNSKMFIDWDFGYRSRWCGVDPWKVAMTLRKNNSPFVEYYDGNLIQNLCEKSVKDSQMYKMYDKYYFVTTKDETFKPKFPMEYDMLIIEYFESLWTIPRNKVIDRFIRKSTLIRSQIEQDEDKYMLRFLLDGKEIYTIPYNEISYPENAVKVMSDEIIRHL